MDSPQARRIRATAAILAVFMAAGALAEAQESGRPSLRADLEELRGGILEKVDSGALPSLSLMVYAEGEWETLVYQAPDGWRITGICADPPFCHRQYIDYDDDWD